MNLLSTYCFWCVDVCHDFDEEKFPQERLRISKQAGICYQRVKTLKDLFEIGVTKTKYPIACRCKCCFNESSRGITVKFGEQKRIKALSVKQLNIHAV